MTTRNICLGILHFFLLFRMSAAQTDAGRPDLLLRSEARLVLLPIRVLDPRGRQFNAPLAASAFQVFEDGREQSIRSFSREDAPSAIALVMDHSGSMSFKLETVADAALTFVRASHPQSETTVINFSEHAYMDAPFTQDVSVITRALGRGTIRGNTALYDAMHAAVQHVSTTARYPRRILVLISDGEDVASLVKPADLTRSLQAAEVTTYAFGLGQMSTENRRAMKRLAQSTGGELFVLKDLPQLKVALSQLASDIRQQYTLAYSPFHTADQPRCHEVRVTLRPNHKGTVYTRTAYCEPEQNRN